MIALNWRKTLRSFLLIISLVAILFLAVGLPGLRFKPGKPLHLMSWVLAQLETENQPFWDDEFDIESSSPNFWLTLSAGARTSIIIAFWLTLSFSIIYAFVSPEFRRDLFRTFMLILPLVLLLPYIARNMTQEPGPEEGQELPGYAPLGDMALPEPPQFVQQPPGWFLISVEILLVVLLVVGIYLILRRLRPESDAQAVVVKHVRKALSDLESGSELDDVVIACYTQMCRELRRSRHVRRHHAMTPREFEDHLSTVGITSTHIRQLTTLFEGARYGAKPTDASGEQKARQCLQSILQAYGE